MLIKVSHFYLFLGTVSLLFHQLSTVSQFQPTVYSLGVHADKDGHLVSTQCEETSQYGFHSKLVVLTQVSYFCYFSLTSSTTCHCEFYCVSMSSKLLVLIHLVSIQNEEIAHYGFHSNTSSVDQGQSFFSCAQRLTQFIILWSGWISRKHFESIQWLCGIIWAQI